MKLYCKGGHFNSKIVVKTAYYHWIPSLVKHLVWGDYHGNDINVTATTVKYEDS